MCIEVVTAIINGVLAAATVGALVVIYYQFKEMQRSTRLDQRAWVGIVGIDATPPSLNQPFAVTVQAKNTGKTPAKKVRSSVYFQDLNAGEMPDFSRDGFSYPSGARSVTLVPPNAPYVTRTDIFDAITQAQLDDWKSRKKIFWVAGKIFYEDIFDCKHWTTFCFYLHPSLQGYSSHEEHNDADNNQCP